MQLVFIGLFAGLAGGMLGIGGSIVMIPAMTEVLGPNQHLYQAAAMIVNFFVVVPAVYQHSRAATVDRTTVMRLIPLGVIAVVFGVWLSELPFFSGDRDAYLRLIFALFLLTLCSHDLLDVLRRRRGNEVVEDVPSHLSAHDERFVTAKPLAWRFAAAVAIPTGLVAGALGVGGGVLAVPLQRRFMKVPMRTAIANSAAVIIATSLVGAIVKNYAYITENGYTTASLQLAFVLIPSAIIGSFVGSRLVHVLPVRVLKIVFFIALAIISLRLGYRAILDIRQINNHANEHVRAGFAEPRLFESCARFNRRWTRSST